MPVGGAAGLATEASGRCAATAALSQETRSAIAEKPWLRLRAAAVAWLQRLVARRMADRLCGGGVCAVRRIRWRARGWLARRLPRLTCGFGSGLGSCRTQACGCGCRNGCGRDCGRSSRVAGRLCGCGRGRHCGRGRFRGPGVVCKGTGEDLPDAASAGVFEAMNC